jgi:hypothetical protein
MRVDILAAVGLGCGAAALAGGCDSLSRKSVEDQQQEAFARAYVAITAKHPNRVADLTPVIGAGPAECAADAQSCSCIWRFLTKEGTKEIKAVAEMPSDSASDDIQVVDAMTDASVTMAPKDAQEAFLTRKCRLLTRDGRIPVRLDDGQVGTVPSASIDDTLRNGASLVSQAELNRAALRIRYDKMSGTELITLCLNTSTRVTALQLGTDPPIRN